MNIFQRMMYVILSITVVCAVSVANYIYLPSGKRVPDDQKTADLLERYYDTNRILLKSMFPYEEPDFALEAPRNMSYSTKEFQQFEGTYLTERESVTGNKYLSKICFCGDSLTYHMGMPGRVLSSYNVLAYGGLRVNDFATYVTNPVYNQSDEKKTSIEWLKELKPEIIYIMLGTNGMIPYALETHISMYDSLLKKITAASPSSIIVLCSVSPWGEAANPKYTDTPISSVNEKIRYFNMYLLEYAKSHGYYYLNGAECMTDLEGYIKEDYVDGDGLHWTNEGRAAYIDYVLNHPIPGY